MGLGVLHSIDEKLNVVRQKPSFKKALKSYITRRDMNSQHRGSENEIGDSTETVRELAWYLIRENMPDADWLGSVLALALAGGCGCVVLIHFHVIQNLWNLNLNYNLL